MNKRLERHFLAVMGLLPKTVDYLIQRFPRVWMGFGIVVFCLMWLSLFLGFVPYGN